METENPTWLAEGLREFTKTAIGSAEPLVFQQAVDDGQGGKAEVPFIITRGPAGDLFTESLLSEVADATKWVTAQRLAKADGPDRRMGVAQHQSLLSFIEHALRFKGATSVVWANPAARTLTSVLDYHHAGHEAKPRWGHHRGVYPCPLSEAWKAWGAGGVLKLDQDDFAALLDRRDGELTDGQLPSGKTSPDPATLISLAANLEVFSTATAKRERDPNTGRVRISYAEDKGASGTVVPPPAFLVFIPIFEDSAPAPLEVRLRVTVEDSHAWFEIQLHQAATILREAFGELCDRVHQETGMQLFSGEPERTT